MTEVDAWGQDPQIRYMRRVFAEIERVQKDLLGRLKVSPFDYRLGRVRERALRLFEEGWVRAERSGVLSGDEEVAILYVHCLAHVLAANRIPVAPEELPRNEKIAQFAKEVLK